MWSRATGVFAPVQKENFLFGQLNTSESLCVNMLGIYVQNNWGLWYSTMVFAKKDWYNMVMPFILDKYHGIVWLPHSYAKVFPFKSKV